MADNDMKKEKSGVDSFLDDFNTALRESDLTHHTPDYKRQKPIPSKVMTPSRVDEMAPGKGYDVSDIDQKEIDSVYDTGFTLAQSSGGIPVQTTETVTKPTERMGEVIEERKQLTQKAVQDLEANQAKLDIELQQAQAEYDKATKDRDALLQRETEVRQQFADQFNQEMGEIQSERERLGKVKPQTFWQKSDTEDKLMIGLALLAGGISQGLRGSGPNPASVQLEKLIDRDVQMQEANIARQLNLLKQRTNDLSLIDRAETKALGKIGAIRLAAMDRMKTAMDKQIMLTKNTQNKQNLIQLKSELEQSILESEQQFEQTLGRKYTSSMQKVLSPKASVETIANEGAKATGQPAKTIADAAKIAYSAAPTQPKNYTEAQGKSLMRINIMSPLGEKLDKLEQSFTPEDFENIGEAMRVFMRDDNLTEVRVLGTDIGKMYEGVRTSNGLTPREVFEEYAGEKGAAYWDAVFPFVHSQTRFDTGAAIKHGEITDEMRKMALLPGMTSHSDLREKVQYRHGVMDAHNKISGENKPLWIYKQKSK